MFLDHLHPAVWPNAHSDLSRFVTTDECLLTHCCGIVAGTQSSTLFEVMRVNQTRWCEGSLNLTLCHGEPPPSPSSDRCFEFWDVGRSNACVVCIGIIWSLAGIAALHAFRLGSMLAGEARVVSQAKRAWFRGRVGRTGPS